MKSKPEDFRIDKCDDCIRITRIDNDKDMHTHLHSRRLAKVIIQNVCNEKIPLNSHSRTLECMGRLTMNEKYKQKLDDLVMLRKSKSKNDYFNPGIKKSF